MTLLSEQVLRVRDILQDADTSATNISKIMTAHQEVLQQLARKDMFPQIQWVNAIAQQGLYTLPDAVVTISHVLYNARVLRFVTEIGLDRKYHGWEDLPGEPHYWTTDNQSSNNTIRIVPTPKRTGSAIPVIPSPLFQNMVDNIVVFHTEDISVDMSDEFDVLPTLFDWDDFLVYETARMLTERETPTQNLSVAGFCAQLAELWRQHIK